MFDWFWSYAVPQAEALVGAGCRVLVVCRTHAHEFDGDYRERESYVRRLKEAGVELVEIDGRVSSVFSWGQVLTARRKVAQFGPDVVHVHDNHDPRLMLIALRRSYALTLHDPRPHLGAHEHVGWRRLVARVWRKRATLLFVHSEVLAEQLDSQATRGHLAVVPHGLDPFQAPVPIPSARNILFFGRFEQYKGLDTLLAAMPRVWEVDPAVRLTLAGRGSCALPAPLDARIRVVNRYISVAELDELFAEATLVVLPYKDASQSGVGCEAIRRGIPVVATSVGGLPDIVLDETYLVPPDDPVALAHRITDKIGHCSETRSRVLGHARDSMSWSVVSKRATAEYARYFP